MPTDTQTITIVLGIIVGVIIRTALPYLKKIQAGEIQSFDPKYIATAIIAIIVGIFVGLEAFSTFIPPVASETWQGIVTVFLAAFTFAYAFQSGLNLVPESVG
jgi:uncharacterized protein YacL